MAALGVWLIVHFAFCAELQLVPDEAYYWVWSRHLALSYFDHPPMAAYLIRLGTALLGDTELGVRCIMLLLAASTLLVISWMARRLIPDSRAVAFVAMAMLCNPIFTVLGIIATPDTPAFFFQTAALATVLSIFAPPPDPLLVSSEASDSLNRGRRWLAFGLLLGLALISKYTSALLGIAVLAALPWSAEGRRHLRTPWPWLGAALSAAVFSPVVWWNAQRNWASFRFQLAHGGLFSSEEPVALHHLGDYMGGQAGVCTPVLFALCVFVLAMYWFRGGLAMHLRILLLAGTVPLALFGVSALRQRPEVNWPIFAYLPATLLVGCYFSEHWTRRRAMWARLAVIVALICTVAIHLPQAFWTIAPRLSVSAFDGQYGWRELAREVDRRRGDLPIIVNQYQDASELTFYLSHHPAVWPVPIALRPTAFDFFPGYQPPETFPRIIVVLEVPKTGPVDPNAGLPPGFDGIMAFPADATWGKHVIRKCLIVLAGRRS